MERDLQWDFFDYIPVVLQDAATRDVLMVQYMTQEGLDKTLDEQAMWLWSRSREAVLDGWPRWWRLRPQGSTGQLYG